MLYFFSSLHNAHAASVNRGFLHPQDMQYSLNLCENTLQFSERSENFLRSHRKLVTKWASNNQQYYLPDLYLPVDFSLFIGLHVLGSTSHTYPRSSCSAAPVNCGQNNPRYAAGSSRIALEVKAASRWLRGREHEPACVFLLIGWGSLRSQIRFAHVEHPWWTRPQLSAAAEVCAKAGYEKCCTTQYNLTTCWINTLLRTLSKRCCLINPAGGIICIFLKSSFSIMQLAFMA